jgi:ribosomal protein S3
MLAAQVQKSADKAVAAISVRAARPGAVVGKKLEHRIEQLHRFAIGRAGEPL